MCGSIIGGGGGGGGGGRTGTAAELTAAGFAAEVLDSLGLEAAVEVEVMSLRSMIVLLGTTGVELGTIGAVLATIVTLEDDLP